MSKHSSDSSSAQPSFFVWDSHSCPTLKSAVNLDDYFALLQKGGAGIVGVNVGISITSSKDSLKLMNSIAKQIEKTSGVKLLQNLDGVEKTKRDRNLGIYFDLEGLEVLDGDLNNLKNFYDAGVRQAIIAYDKDNIYGGASKENSDRGLTDLGRRTIREMNRLGIICDVSHLNEKTALEIVEISALPVIASHSGPLGLKKHHRNVSDKLIKAIAAKGGIVGMIGFAPFLANDANTVATYVDHLEYLIDLVGAQHVGVGLDYVHHKDEMFEHWEKLDNKPVSDEIKARVKFISPEQYPAIANELKERGHSHEAIQNVMGNNFLRLAKQVWK